VLALVRRAREAVVAGRFAAFRQEFLDAYHSGESLAPSLSSGT
jgi:queuine/archaeosine tRNA-ribosyltransferase